MRHPLRYDDNVARLDFAARVSHHRAAAGWAVQNGCHFGVWRRPPPVDDGAPSDQGRATGYDDIAFSSVIMEDAAGACRTGTLLTACRRRVCRRRAASGIATAAAHRPTVDDRDPKLILVHIDHPERIIRDRSLRIE